MEIEIRPFEPSDYDEALAQERIFKAHLFVHAENRDAQELWAHLGWVERGGFVMMSKTSSGAANA
jgi:hypothetical protein